MGGIGNGTTETIARWAAENPKVRRVWILGKAREPRLDLAIEIEPVADSEEALAVWMAHADEWRAALRERVSAAVEVSWIDANGATRGIPEVLDQPKVLVYDRSA